MPDFFAILAPRGAEPAAAPPMELSYDDVRVQARILGHGRRHGRFGPTTFDIQVRTPGAEYKYIVQRRYSLFLALEADLRPQLFHLPPLPPKSNFRKRLRPTSFMANRERKLGVFLAALLSVDPTAESRNLSRFLGVGLLGRVPARKSYRDSCDRNDPSSAFASTCGSLGQSTNLSMISEDEEEGSGINGNSEWDKRDDKGEEPEAEVVSFPTGINGDSEWDKQDDKGKELEAEAVSFETPLVLQNN